MDRGRLSRTYQQHIFDGCQPAVCRQNWPRCPRRLDVGRSHPDTRLGVGRGTIGRRRRGRHGISPVGRFLLGASLLRSFRKVDRHARPRLACRRCCALGHPDLVARMVRAGALISVLAADLHVSSPTGSAFWSISRRRPCTRYSSGSVARPRSVEHCKDGHSFKYGAWPPLPESYSSGLLRSSPPTIANCLGSVGIRPSTRPSSGIC